MLFSEITLENESMSFGMTNIKLEFWANKFFAMSKLNSTSFSNFCSGLKLIDGSSSDFTISFSK